MFKPWLDGWSKRQNAPLPLASYHYDTILDSRACQDSLAFRFIAANTHPDHDTIGTLRTRFDCEIKDIFIQVLTVSARMKLEKLKTISLDGSKVKINASKYSALSFEHAGELEKRLRAEVEDLCRLAEQAEGQVPVLDLYIPKELKRREERLMEIQKAKAEIEARAAERVAQEKTEYEACMAKREAQQQK